MTFFRAFLILCVVLAGLLLAVWRGVLDVPPRWNPWAVLDIRETPNLSPASNSGGCRTTLRCASKP
jgi:hypothetical protein